MLWTFPSESFVFQEIHMGKTSMQKYKWRWNHVRGPFYPSSSWMNKNNTEVSFVRKTMDQVLLTDQPVVPIQSTEREIRSLRQFLFFNWAHFPAIKKTIGIFDGLKAFEMIRLHYRLVFCPMPRGLWHLNGNTITMSGAILWKFTWKCIGTMWMNESYPSG